ncbi:Endonuclease III [Alteracholeplasma palmae J233]|uniref:Endonuclease III n=1 Tax=Alteracholeplasma palmae (strain ATCC 49389 / J233) TaxID=1318466 RepID=U4KLM0_ALTPJ|nr:endonuclease III [Alteracholeplasma palmae]CCV64772.1 Endonuclease III [Alteracholeplasma palmae J233]
MTKQEFIIDYLDKLIPDPKPELDFTNNFELLVAVVLSAQTTDKAVNKVTPELFSKYPTPEKMKDAELEDLERILKGIGLYKNKAKYIKSLSESLYKNFNSIVPNNREDLESLTGVGRKTANVVLSNAFNIPAFAVDTHVARVTRMLQIATRKDSVLEIEQKLMDFFPKESWSRLHHQFILFGRYYLKARNPEVEGVILVLECDKYHKKESRNE